MKPIAYLKFEDTKYTAVFRGAGIVFESHHSIPRVTPERPVTVLDVTSFDNALGLIAKPPMVPLTGRMYSAITLTSTWASRNLTKNSDARRKVYRLFREHHMYKCRSEQNYRISQEAAAIITHYGQHLVAFANF